MLRIYGDILDWITVLRPVIQTIARHDRNLADQLQRSSTSVCLNVAEGMGACGKSKTACYRIALREMRESIAAVEIAERLQYIRAMNAAKSDRQSKIVGTLVRLAIPAR